MVREANLLASRTDRLFLAVLGGPPGPGVLIDGSFDAGAAQLWIAEDTFRALSPEAAGTPDLVRLPGFLLSALVELALENPIEAFRDALASEFLQREAKLGSAPDRPGLGLRLEDCGAPLILYLGDGALERVFERLEAAPIFRGDALESVATLEVIFEAARTDLSLEELAALRPGDVVLLTLDEVPPGARAVLRDSDEALGRVRLEGETATLVRLGRRDMEDDTDDTEAGVDIDALEVTLRFSLGSAAVTVEALRGLAEGYVFELDLPPDAAVRIYAGRQLVGTGEIVEIADRLGVRVARLNEVPRGR